MKLYRGQRVKINISKGNKYLKGHGFEGIVQEVSRDKCSLLILDKEPWACAWYNEGEVTLIKSNYDKNMEILEKFEEENDMD